MSSSLEALQYQLENERPLKTEALVCAAPPPTSIVADLQAEIDQLKENLSKSSTERSLLLTKLDDVEVELKNTLHQQTSTLMDYDTRISDKDLLIEEQTERADQK